MENNQSQLESIFDSVCQDQDLPIKQEDNRKTAQGPFFYLEFEQQEDYTRLAYVDGIASAGFYAAAEENYLSYTVLSEYQTCQAAFLNTLDSDLAKTLHQELVAKKSPADRLTFKVDLTNLSEVDQFLSDHLEHY